MNEHTEQFKMKEVQFERFIQLELAKIYSFIFFIFLFLKQ